VSHDSASQVRGRRSSRFVRSFRSCLTPARTIASGVVDALLPQTCVACERWIPADEAPACAACQEIFKAAAVVPYCPRCGRTASPLSIHDKGCARCRTERFWNVAGIARVGLYREEMLRRMLVGLKFIGSERQADYVGSLLAAALRKREWLKDVEALVPVPMHRLRRWQRSCDHARLLAEALSRQLNIPVRRAAVRRVKYSISQTRTQSQAQRFKNIKGCFAPTRRPDITGKTVCIIDNLLVTGATIHEVSKVLRKAGARRIYAAVVARSTLPGDPQPQPAAASAPRDRPD
jgi:ComF family protein